VTGSLEDYLPTDLRALAARHFTPPVLARRIAAMLAPSPGTVVLDVGAGPGLFCVAAALAAGWAQFVGVEWRPRLVEVATTLARELQVSNLRFVHGNAFDVDWSQFDAFYLFNPFAEHVMPPELVIDHNVPLHPSLYEYYVEGVRDRLAALPLGTRVVTYNGFGGELPRTYVLASSEPYGSDSVELWIRTR
jgi:SAM-dependent methyltransferase